MTSTTARSGGRGQETQKPASLCESHESLLVGHGVRPSADRFGLRLRYWLRLDDVDIERDLGLQGESHAAHERRR